MKTCLKCGGNAYTGFDTECRHDFGEEGEVLLAEHDALVDALLAGSTETEGRAVFRVAHPTERACIEHRYDDARVGLARLRTMLAMRTAARRATRMAVDAAVATIEAVAKTTIEVSPQKQSSERELLEDLGRALWCAVCGQASDGVCGSCGSTERCGLTRCEQINGFAHEAGKPCTCGAEDCGSPKPFEVGDLVVARAEHCFGNGLGSVARVFSLDGSVGIESNGISMRTSADVLRHATPAERVEYESSLREADAEDRDDAGAGPAVPMGKATASHPKASTERCEGPQGAPGRFLVGTPVRVKSGPQAGLLGTVVADDGRPDLRRVRRLDYQSDTIVEVEHLEVATLGS